MRFFIDTAKVEDIKKANDMGVICGVTTNPSLIAKEGRDFNEVIKEITSIPIFFLAFVLFVFYYKAYSFCPIYKAKKILYRHHNRF